MSASVAMAPQSNFWPSWEIHPDAYEFVYLIDSAATLLLEQGAAIRWIDIPGGNALTGH